MPDFLTDWGDFRDGILGITLGTVNREQADIFNTLLTSSPPADPNAQRERKWAVKYRDIDEYLDALSTIANPYYQQIFYMEIGTADYSLLLTNQDIADPADAAVIAFVDAFELIVKSPAVASAPQNGAVEVMEIRAVGRST